MNRVRWSGGKRVFVVFLSSLLLWGSLAVHDSYGATAQEIEADVDDALRRFEKEVQGAGEILKSAKGILVLGNVVKAGFIFGGEYGEGALRIEGKTVDYYSMIAGSFGLQIGAQRKDILLAFMQEEPLKRFQESTGWKAGADASVVLVDGGETASIDTNRLKEPVLMFVFGTYGLMANATVEGAKFTRLRK